MAEQQEVNILINLQDQATEGMAALGKKIEEVENTTKSFGQSAPKAMNRFSDVIDKVKSGVMSFSQSLEENLGSALNDGISKIKDFGNVASIALGYFATQGLKSVIQSAAEVQQTSAAFTVMIGNAKTAKALMNDLMNFSDKTPFTFSLLTNVSKELLSVGFTADQIKPKLQMLGDLSLGNPEKLKELVDITSQVQAVGHTTGGEDRRFSQGADINIVQALTDYYNKNHIAVKNVGDAHSKASTKIADVKDKMAILNQKALEMNTTHHVSAEKLETMNKQYDKYKGQLADANSYAFTSQSTIDTLTLKMEKQKATIDKAGESHTVAKSKLMSMDLQMDKYQQTLDKAAKATGGLGSGTKITTEEMTKMISKGLVNSKDVNGALEQLASKGGRYFGQLEAQSTTFNGLMSTAQTHILEFGRNLIGVSNSGDIKQGGMFYYLNEGLTVFLANSPKGLDVTGKKIFAFKEEGLKYFKEFQESVGKAFTYIMNIPAIKNMIKDGDALKMGLFALGGLAIATFASIGIAVLSATWPFLAIMASAAAVGYAFMHMTEISKFMKDHLGIDLTEIVVSIQYFSKLLWEVAKVILPYVGQIAGGIFNYITGIIKGFMQLIGDMFDKLFKGFQIIVHALNMIPGMKIPEFSQPQFNAGTNHVPNELSAMVNKGEMIIPKKYNPNVNGGNSSGMGGKGQILNFYNTFDKQYDESQIASKIAFQVRGR